MTQSSNRNRQIVLNKRPEGAPVADDFRQVNSEVPEPRDNEVLLRTIYLSLDPYMRGRMSDAKSYAEPVAIGDVMVGATVSRVEKSLNKDFKSGDLVVAFSGWQDYSISDGSDLLAIDSALQPASFALGVMGMPGLTAYMGLLDIGQPKPGETLVVAAATGAVGSLVGQIAKIKGCRVVAIAGGEEKCRYAVDVLGFDQCINHKDTDFAGKLAAACDKGIDVYFENVGGKVFDAVMPLLNSCARVPVCGLISQYNALGLPQGYDRLPLIMATLLVKRIRMQGFIVFDDYGHSYMTFSKAMAGWLSEGKIQYREDRVEGLERAVDAFIGLLEGKNFGKLIVQVGPDELKKTD